MHLDFSLDTLSEYNTNTVTRYTDRVPLVLQEHRTFLSWAFHTWDIRALFTMAPQITVQGC